MDQMAALVSPTLGPVARTVAIDSLVSSTPEILDSGATIARRTIELPDPFEDMGAMLVRHLLLSVFEAVGDGTATTAVLTRSLVHRVARYLTGGGDMAQLERGLVRALNFALLEIGSRARPIQGADAITSVAVGVVRERKVASIIGEILDATGADGAVVVEEGDAIETSCEYMEGMRWNEGLVSEAFLDPGLATVRLLDTRILVTDCALETPEQLLPAIDACIAAGERRLFVIAPEIREPVIGLLVLNRQRGVLDGAAAVRAPSTGEVRAGILGDLAIACGGHVLQAAANGLRRATLSDLGWARQVWATRQAFGVLGGRGNRGAIRERVAQARADLTRAADDRHLRSMTQQRIGRLFGLGAVIRVGAPSQLEREELRLRTEAAVSAARLALRDGVVPGGGAALAACADALCRRQATGEQRVADVILADALTAPMRVIARNAGCVEPAALVAAARRRGPDASFDVVRRTWVDAWQADLVDPAPVVRTALEAAFSGARTAMTTGALARRRQTAPPAGR
jgi:chaperonin GroEL